MEKLNQDIFRCYEERVNAEAHNISKLQKELNSISLQRLGVFLIEIVFIAIIIYAGFSWLLTALLIFPVVAFLYLVKKQVRKLNEKEYASKLFWVYQNELNVSKRLENAYDNGARFSTDQHPYTSDLDIYGPASVFALINRCMTSDGNNRLAQSLAKPSARDIILSRQNAIREMRDQIEQTFHFRALLQDHDPARMEQIRQKLSTQLPKQLAFTRSSWLRIYVRIAPFIMLLLLIAGVSYGGLAWNIFGLAALLNGAIVGMRFKQINRLYLDIGGSSALLNSFATTIRWTENYEKNSSSTSSEIENLGKIIRDFDARLNLLLAPFLNLFLLWDLKCAFRLADWHDRASQDLLEGLDMVGKYEMIISFATLAYNEPNWSYPTISDKFCLTGRAIGHPLIGDEARVVNDFEFEGHPTTDIITGSNMAGKSTFLRTIGVNLVLAYAGAPVCAKEMTCAIFNVVSYMRIKDSLNDQTSTFKAELNRLKMILELTAIDPHALVLIDEMLRGTNSRDKFLGSKVFIEKLIAQQTATLFATHDLQLSELETTYPESVRNYHFDIQISDHQMHFDYQLKKGPCKTFNAAILLSEIGLSLN